jgi:hypothetical protein
MTLPDPKENETRPSSCPPFPGSDESLSDAQIRMESEKSFIITSVFRDKFMHSIGSRA